MTKAGTKTCKRCQEPLALDQFRKAPTRFGGDGYSNNCKPCIAIEKAARVTGTEPATSEPEVPIDPGHQLQVPYCMPVDCVWNGTDFVLTQDNDGTEMTIFLAPHALRRIFEFGEGLALQQAAAPVAAPAT